jgi:GNAT superfamily N-acetyltransferase
MNGVKPTLDVRPVRAADWPALEKFFGPSGAYGNCWCAYFRVNTKDFEAGARDHGAGNRAVLRRVTESGDVPGLLAYDGAEPVGWVSVSPRPRFGRVLRSPLLKPRGDDDAADEGTWSVVCFWVPRAHRGRRVASVPLDAAVRHAAAAGAAAVEGYPVEVAAGARAADASMFTGSVAMFERAGFTRVPPTPTGDRRGRDGRPVMRRTL